MIILIRSILFILIGIIMALGEFLEYYQFGTIGRIISLVFYIPTLLVFCVMTSISVIKILKPLLDKIAKYYVWNKE